MLPFRVLHTPVTSAPSALAICTAKVPTPPAAPLIKIFWPRCNRPLSRSACRAESAATGTAAACSNVRLAGFSANLPSTVHAYSANAPLHVPKTMSPGWNCVTPLPSASTCPATSTPRRGHLGLRNPVAMRTSCGVPRMKCQSSGFTDAARTRSNTSPSFGTGRSISANRRTSAVPYSA